MRVGLAADHGGLALKQALAEQLQSCGYAIVDFGAFDLDSDDDYPDFVVPLAHAVAGGQVDRGLALCGSGIGASVAANKVAGVRAALIHDIFSAHQGVEDDDMNILCLGGKVIGPSLASNLSTAFWPRASVACRVTAAGFRKWRRWRMRTPIRDGGSLPAPLPDPSCRITPKAPYGSISVRARARASSSDSSY